MRMNSKGHLTNSSDIAELIKGIESRFPINEWTIENIRIWPLIRIRLYLDLANAHVLHSGRSMSFSQAQLLLSKAFGVLEGLVRYACASAADYGKNRQPDKSNVVFLSDGVSYSMMNGFWYEKFCGPFIEYFNSKNIPCFLMTQTNRYQIPRYHPSKFIQPHLDCINIKGRVTSRLRSHWNERLPGFADFCGYLKSKELKIKVPTLQTARTDVLLVRLMADFLKKEIKIRQASLGFTVSYYGILGYAFNLACRELGIPSIDIQHGCQGDLHLAYGGWSNVPADGYELLPSLFWCWGDYEADVIDKWSANAPRRHSSLKGGNLLLDKWMYGDSSLAKYYDDIFLKMKGPDKDRKHIIITQGGGIHKDHFLNIIDAAKKAPDSWFWWIRLHPCELNLRIELKGILKDNGINHFNIDDATDLPLYGILKHMDCHVTAVSSTVLEAETLGIPSVITHSDGIELYKKQVSSEWAVAAFTPEDIIGAIKRQIGKKISHSESRIRAGDGRAALQHLLCLIREHTPCR